MAGFIAPICPKAGICEATAGGRFPMAMAFCIRGGTLAGDCDGIDGAVGVGVKLGRAGAGEAFVEEAGISAGMDAPAEEAGTSEGMEGALGEGGTTKEDALTTEGDGAVESAAELAVLNEGGSGGSSSAFVRFPSPLPACFSSTPHESSKQVTEMSTVGL